MKLSINPSDFRPKSGDAVDVTRYPTRIDDIYADKDGYKKMLEDYMEEIQDLQSMMYAHDRYSLLVIFQGMDASGKDGLIKHVMSGINPAGVHVSYFKKPSDSELDHDFLWRTTQCLPERGRIGIFNRSYYEEVLIVRVHPEILQKYQRIPEEFRSDEKKVWKHRIQDIAAFEAYMHRQGTQIVKFFVHVSRDEQKTRLLERIEEPDKNWKMNPQDVEERGYWKEYMHAYSEAISATNTDHSPWYIIPADGKRNARLIVQQILLHHLRNLPMKYPEISGELKARLDEIRKKLEAE